MLAALAARADNPFLTETWNNGITSNWTVTSGTPLASGGTLTNGSLAYAPSLAMQDYSVQTVLNCYEWAQYSLSFAHYLRYTNWGSYYQVEAWWWPGHTLQVRIWRLGDLLAQTTSTCGTMKSSIQGGTITVYMDGTPILSVADSTFSSGKPGVGAPANGSGGSLGQTVLAYLDTQPPTVPTGLTAAAYSTRVNLSWTVSTDNVGVTGYKVYRGGSYLGSSATNSYSDVTVYPVTTYSYTVSAYDGGGNESAQSAALSVATPAPAYSAPDAGGPVEYATTWGAGPEKIALLTGALSLRIPLFKLQQRTRGPGFSMLASWNSQFWSWDAGGTRMNALDTGYGLGFLFAAGGGVYPVYNGNLIDRFEFQDAAGVIHKLYENPAGSKKYKSQDSTYLVWDYNPSPPTLTFTDGTVWFFDCYSRDPEPDAGTRYPTKLKDTNGNLITIIYQAAAGLTGTNSSSRITSIQDSLTSYTWEYNTINGAAHVSRVYHYQSPGQQFNDALFTYTTRNDIVSPFSVALTGQPLTRVLLTQITFTGSPGPFVFDYNTSAEITKVTFPYKGYFRYEYAVGTYSNGTRQIREIYPARYMSADGTAASEQAYNISHPDDDPALPQHKQTVLLDPAGNKKIWYFIYNSPNGWDNGLENKYETYQGPSPNFTIKQTIDTAWTQDDLASQTLTNPRAASVTTTRNEAGVTLTWKREPVVDANGNVTVVKEYAHGILSTPWITTTTSYLSTTNYTSRNILNRPLQVTVCSGAAGCAQPASVTNFTYDGSAITAVPGITQHDSAYNYLFAFRGNPTQVDANGLLTKFEYDEGGNLLKTKDGLDHEVGTAGYSATTGQVQNTASGGNTTTLAWNADTTLSSATGSNTDTVSFTYSSYRPRSTTPPGMGVFAYSYSDMDQYGNLGQPWTYPFTQTESAPLGRQTVTTLDGFGRVIKKAVKENSTTWSYTETQYNACSCTSTGKAVKVSRPYRTGETVYWTETKFDALGRPTQVILPDGATTNYTYTVESGGSWNGLRTQVTDPAGKTKRYLYDTLGFLRRVEEPNASGTLIETARYYYDVMGRLTTVYMGQRADLTFKQTRTFVYNTKGQLTSATNPENGTVSYTYMGDGLVDSKTDAKNQILTFGYDTYHRLLLIRSQQGSGGTPTDRVRFTYDTAGTIPTSYAQGRMTTAWSDSGYTWHFAYDQPGRVTQQTLQTPPYITEDANGNPVNWGPLYAQAQYVYGTEGRLSYVYYPGAQQLASAVQPGTHYQYTYDVLNRPLTLSYLETNNSWYNLAQNAQYNAAGQITSWQETLNQYGAGMNTLSRSYKAERGWITNLQAVTSTNQTVLNLSYAYLPNGRVSSVTDAVNPGQSANYTYDQLNRLATASTPNWGLSWTYDDFGNRLTQTPTAGTPPQSTLTYDETTNRITGYTYDANGNLTAMPGKTFTYDAFDRLLQGGTYDAFGRRITNAGGRIFFYDPSGKLLAEYQSLCLYCAPAVKHLYFAGQRLGQWTDRTGNVRYASGAWKHYYPYGEEITSTASDTYKFAQLYRDGDTGLDYAVNRYYASTVGRFVTADPLREGAGRPGSPTTWNLYSYTAGDPINGIDPLGLDFYELFRNQPAAAAAAAVEVVELYAGNGATTGANGVYCVGDTASLLVSTHGNSSGGFTMTIYELATGKTTRSVYGAGSGGLVRALEEVNSGGIQTYTTTARTQYDGTWGSVAAGLSENGQPFLPQTINGPSYTMSSRGVWFHTDTGNQPQGEFELAVTYSAATGGLITINQNYRETQSATQRVTTLDISHYFENGVMTSFRQASTTTIQGQLKSTDNNTFTRCGDLPVPTIPPFRKER